MNHREARVTFSFGSALVVHLPVRLGDSIRMASLYDHHIAISNERTFFLFVGGDSELLLERGMSGGVVCRGEGGFVLHDIASDVLREGDSVKVIGVVRANVVLPDGLQVCIECEEPSFYSHVGILTVGPE